LQAELLQYHLAGEIALWLEWAGMWEELDRFLPALLAVAGCTLVVLFSFSARGVLCGGQ
jgi:hypothetical protein